ncbi:MAG TPA: outer membrane beta-barrel protein [Bryobacteraceae bacterium]|nr:outer membrane beta-barrel protein [Bryobacteraceae bacterium]
MFKKQALLGYMPILAAFLVFGSTAKAQETTTPRYEVGLNYSGLHVNSANYDYQRTGNGGSGYFEYNLNKTLGLVADFGGYANTRSGIDEKLMTYLFGPRWNWRHARLTPYVQFLFGGAYVWNNNLPGGISRSQNAFATAAGGGLDYTFNNHIAFKPIQVEYVMTQIDAANKFGSHQNDIRYSAGVVFRFGSK